MKALSTFVALFLGLLSTVALAQNSNCSFGIALAAPPTEEGDTVDVAVTARHLQDLVGLQYTHSWNPVELSFLEVVGNNDFPTSVANFNQQPAMTSQGKLPFSWLDNTLAGVNLSDGTALYHLRFVKLTAAPALVGTDGSFTAIEMVTNAGGPTAVNLFFLHAWVEAATGPDPGLAGACITPQACNDPTTGAIDLGDATGNVVTYAWSGPGAYSNTVADITGLLPGQYALTLTNDQGLTRLGDFYVGAPEELSVTIAVDNDECGLPPDGGLSAEVTGGSGNYAYSWSTGAATPTISGLAPGSYGLTVTDAGGGCSLTAQATVESESLITILAQDIQPAACTGATDGAIDLNVYAPAPAQPLTYAWSNGATTEDLSNVPTGNYQVTISGADGCDLIAAFTVPYLDNGNWIDVDSTPPSCGQPGTITLNLDPAAYTFAWSDGQTTATATGLTGGDYSVTVTANATGCTYERNFTLEDGDPIVATVLDCVVIDNQDWVEITALVWNNSDGPYTFEWSDGTIETGSLLSTVTLPAGPAYTVTVTSEGGCSTTVSTPTDDCGNEPQLSLYLSPYTVNAQTGDQVCLDLTVEDFVNIVSGQLTITWDETQLAFDEVTNFNLPGLSLSNFGIALTDDGALTFSYNVPVNDDPVTLADGASLFTVCFTVLGDEGSTTVNVDDFPTYIEFYNNNGEILLYGFNYATVQMEPQGTSLQLAVGTTLAHTGETVCLPVTANGFNNLGQLSFDLSWDPVQLTFAEIQGLETLDLNLAENFSSLGQATTEGVLAFDWMAGGTGVDLPNGATLFELCLQAGEEPGFFAVEMEASSLDAADSAGDPVSVDAPQNGGVTVQSVTDPAVDITIGTAGAPPASSVCIPVTAHTFNEVVGMQFSIAWDDELVYFNQLNINSALPGLDASDFNAAAGQDFLSVVWFNPSLEAVSLPAGTELFELCFTTLDAEGIVPVQFVETPAYAEFIGDDGVLPMTLTDGQIDITVDGLVWPGDTDNNQLANHFDLLNIGLAYGATGAQRPNASTTWQAQAAPLWNLATPESAVDYRHVDTNGDGTINAQDTLALALNWGLESDNFLTGENGDGGATPLDGPPIFIQPDTIPAGATVALPIILGLPDDVIAAAYGLAFTVEYNPDLILPGSVHVTHDGWLGTPGTDLIGMYHDYYSQGRCEVALVRTNAMNVMGEGAVGHFIVTMEDVIFRDEVDVELPFRIVNPRLITYAEEEIPLTPRLTVTLVENLVNTRDLLLESAVSIWPNPTAERIQIRTDNLRLNQVTLLDMRGRILATFRNAPTQLDLSTYPAGLYQVHLQTEEGVVQKLVVKQ